MPKILFSIITCSYNSELYIERNLKSITKQSFRDFEHIIIDGFSKDKTIDITNKGKNGTVVNAQ